MTIDEMIERLTEYRDEMGGDAEVRLMTQPNWPFEHSIKGLASSEEILECCRDEDEDGESDDEPENVVFIVESRQLSYGSKMAWEAAR